MTILVGGTGFVGRHLARAHEFQCAVHRSDATSITGRNTDLLVCAGLPAEKWRANQYPSQDWANMCSLTSILASVRAKRAVLISTIDVYQPAVGVDETNAAQFDGAEAYGSHRAWFEAFFKSHFPKALIRRLPALYAPDVRKNLIHDLLHRKSDQYALVNPFSTFQFFDVTKTWAMIERAWAAGIQLLNITSEPICAQAVADLFDVSLNSQLPPKHYDMRSVHAESLGGSRGYLYSAEAILEGISSLRESLQS